VNQILKEKRFFKRKWTLSGLQSLCVILISTTLIWAVTVLLNSGSYIKYYLRQCLSSPLLAVLNYIPILLFCLLLFLVFRHAPLSAILTCFVFSLMAAINLIKTNLRQDPFVPADIGLAREALGVIGSYGIGNLLLLALLVLLTGTLCAFVLLKWRRTAIPLPVRLAGIGLCLVAAALSYRFAYANNELYNTFDYTFGGKDSEYGCKGFVYSFIHDISAMKVQKPENYSAADYEALESAALPIGSGETAPHVIMIMGEAYSHLSRSEHFDFSDHTDPTRYFMEAAEDALLSGYLAADVNGGGTAYTEFSSLTGISPVILSTETSPYNFIRSDTDSIAWSLKRMGYDTLAIHPGNGWFYNRNNVYRYLGFDDFLYLESSFDPETQNKGGRISEEATFDLLIEEFQSHLEESDAPLFEFCVTIQNHSGYFEKYFTGTEANFDTNVELTPEEINTLSNYFEGMLDADAQFHRLIQYLEALDEPVVLVYFGDHLPSVTDILQKIGYGQFGGDIKARLQMYTVPYIIWANDAALSQTSLSENLKNSTLSSETMYSVYYLAPALMELLGMDGVSPFFSAVNTMRDSLPILTWSIYADGNGALSTELPAGLDEAAAFYKEWSYYKLFDQVL